MKKLLLFTLFLTVFASMSVAVPFCGSTCPTQCIAAGKQCTSQVEQQQTTVNAKQLSCIKKQNAGCGFNLGWPLVQGNQCPAGFTYDASIDGPEDCGFLGLGAIFGGSVKYCHSLQEITCTVNATCSPGFQVSSSSACSLQQQQSTSLQCCQIGGEPNNDFQVPEDDAPNTNQSNALQVTQLQLEPQNAFVSSGGSIQFTVRGLTLAGLSIVLEEDVQWSISDSTLGNLSQSGLFTACATCTGQTTVFAGYGPLLVSTTIHVTQLTDYRVEPQNVTIAQGGDAVFNATGLNVLTNKREQVPSTWFADIGNLIYPVSSQASGVAVLRATTGGNGTVQATSGPLSRNASVFIVPSAGFQATELVAYPSSVEIAEGEQQKLTVTARNSQGVYGPLPGQIIVNVTNSSIVQMAGDEVKGIAAGATSLNVSSGNLSIIVDVLVKACNAGTQVQCTDLDNWDSTANGVATKTCQTGGVWSACVDLDKCDGANPGQPNSVADGIACGWCVDPSVNDPDCICTAGQSKVCTDAATNCWGSMSCSASNKFGACIASSACTGEVFGAPPSGYYGLFNGFICTSTQSVPELNLETVSSCQGYGSTYALSSITGGEQCQTSSTFELLLDTTVSPAAINWIYISNPDIPGVNYTLSDITPGGAMLDINDTSTGNIVPVLLQVGGTVSFNAKLTLLSLNTSVAVNENGVATRKSATVKFEYDDCLFNVQLVPS